MFIGTSQTIGAGARDLDETFFARVHHHLRDALPHDNAVESFNVSVSGLQARELLSEYEGHYQGLHPNLVVINLSNTDVDPQSFSTSMRRFLMLNQESGIKTLLIEEANSREHTSHLLVNHRELEKLGAEFHVAVYSLHEYLNQPSIVARGALWWDPVHLTSYGHELVSDWLTPKLLIVASARTKCPPRARPLCRGRFESCAGAASMNALRSLRALRLLVVTA